MNDSSGAFISHTLPGATRAPTPVGGEVSVIMVVYRTGPALTESIAHVLADPEVDELILVDNGSTVEEMATMDAVAAVDQRVTVIRGQANVGFARGANMGAKAAHGNVLVVLNPDAFLEDGCIAALCAALRDQAVPMPCGRAGAESGWDGATRRAARRG